MAKTQTSERQALTVKRREAVGSRPVTRLRNSEAVIPGIVYGGSQKPIAVTVDAKTFQRILHSKAGEHALLTLKLDGEPWEKPVLIKDTQHDALDGHVLHVDFHAIDLKQEIKVKIPVVLKGEPVGVKQEGGILEHFMREVEVSCLPTEIPAGVEYDVSAMSIGTTIHVKDLVAPANAKILSDPEGAIASVQQPKVEKPEEEAPAITEPEVLREKKPEAEGEAKDSGAAPEAKKDQQAEKKEQKAEK